MQIRLFQLRGGGQNNIGVVGGVGQKQFMDNREQVLAPQALRNLAGVRRGGRGIGAEYVERHDRRVGCLAQQGGAEPIHVYGAAGRRAVAPMMHRLLIPLQIAAGAVGEAAAFYTILSC